MRGNTLLQDAWRTSPAGLSPRVRGNHGQGGPALPGPGSIPACAGEPPVAASKHRTRRDYPRVCGGTSGASLTIGPMHGLSPRVRGNQVGDGRRQRRGRSIPACAGKPGVRRAAVFRGRVYPRVCGGTSATETRQHALGVYPRVCGGTCWRPRNSPTRKGLSPRVRGNPESCSNSRLTTRSIPACAGEPLARRNAVVLQQVYPRVCGGTLGKRMRSWPRKGLSPRVRGNRAAFCRFELKTRSIPACAGEPTAAWTK